MTSMAALKPPQPDERTPRHVAIIMDGNGRWAGTRGLPRAAGHQAGAEAVRRTLRACMDHGIGYLTIFAFSSENWRRPDREVGDLMNLLRYYLRKESRQLVEKNIRVGFIGDRAGLPEDVLGIMAQVERETSACTELTMTVALNYGARDEIVRAARSLVADCLAGTVPPDDIGESELAARLDTAGLPDPDLVIRTSGEQRLSNFLAWQATYAELVFIPVLWPDFARSHFDRAIDEFRRRDRRYGAVSAS